MGVHIRKLFLKTTVSVNSVSEQTQKTDTKGNVKSFMKNRGYDMKNGNQSVGQASRLSEDSWRRHLPHFQLHGDSRDGCPTVGGKQ